MQKQSPAERLFALTCCLMASPRVGLSKQDLYRAVAGYQGAESESARDRMFERDKETLREAGVRLEVLENDGFDDTEQSRYRIARASFEWPKDLQLSPVKLQLLTLAAKAWNSQLMESAAQSGLTKLKSLGLVAKEMDLTPINPRLLTRDSSFAPLAAAIANRNLVAFRYQKPDGQLSDRQVAPLKLRLLQGQWVLLGMHDNHVKNFLLRRITSQVSILDRVFSTVGSDTIGQAEQDLMEYVSGNVAVLRVLPDTEAALRFRPGEDQLAQTTFMDEELFAEDLLEYGSTIEVLSPDSLKRRLRADLKAVIKLHA